MTKPPFTDAEAKKLLETCDAPSTALVNFLAEAYGMPDFVRMQAIERFDTVEARNFYLTTAVFAMFIAAVKNMPLDSVNEMDKETAKNLMNECIATAARITFN